MRLRFQRRFRIVGGTESKFHETTGYTRSIVLERAFLGGRSSGLLGRLIVRRWAPENARLSRNYLRADVLYKLWNRWPSIQIWS